MGAIRGVRNVTTDVLIFQKKFKVRKTLPVATYLCNDCIIDYVGEKQLQTVISENNDTPSTSVSSRAIICTERQYGCGGNPRAING